MIIRCYTSPSATSSSGALSFADPTTATTRPFCLASSTSFSPVDRSPVGVKADVAGMEMLGENHLKRCHKIFSRIPVVETPQFPLICRPSVDRQELASVQQADQIGPTYPSHLKLYQWFHKDIYKLHTFSSFRVLTGRGLIWRGPDFRSPESCSRHVREAGVDVKTFKDIFCNSDFNWCSLAILAMLTSMLVETTLSMSTAGMSEKSKMHSLNWKKGLILYIWSGTKINHPETKKYLRLHELGSELKQHCQTNTQRERGIAWRITGTDQVI